MKSIKLWIFFGCAVASASCQSNKATPPKFGYFQCRADAQKWTVEPFDSNDERNRIGGTAVMVNGQFRSMPHITLHATVSELLKRSIEMKICVDEDSEFEKKYLTYSFLADRYGEERCFRYMYFLTKHNLDEQFEKEDDEANK